MKTVKINNTEFIRDLENKAVLNTDRDGLRTYQRTRENLLREKNEREETKQRLQVLEQNINEIKQLLSDIATLRNQNGNQ